MSIKDILSTSINKVYSGTMDLVDRGDQFIGENSKKILADKDDSKKFIEAINLLADDDKKEIIDLKIGNESIIIEML